MEKGNRKMGVYSKFNRPIVVVDYDPQWPVMFEKEKEAIIAALGNRFLMVEHIGSTAVPGLAAKPVIDMAVGIQSLADAPVLIPCIEGLGYFYDSALEQLVPERRFFWKGTPTVHTCHLHLAQVDHPVLLKPLQFRDFLRQHPDAAEAYGVLKRELAKKCVQDLDAYVGGKTGFVENVMLKIEKDNERYRAA
jgi:GrpB-like predicted nucleotidyltransferase (UPF0157 family)